MHKGFLRQLSDEHADFVKWLLMKRMWSRFCTKDTAEMTQNILDQLYYKYVEVFEDDLWTGRSSFTATEPLVTY
eukprot:2484686-Karenia_brevis.AAC.1